MARMRRLKVVGEEAFYHVTTRTLGQEFLLGDVEKEKLLSIIKCYSRLYFVKIVGFAIMSNHWHLLLKMETGAEYSDEEIVKRVEAFFLSIAPTEKVAEKWQSGFMGSSLVTGRKRELREKLGDLSEFIKVVKQKFSYWYNRRNNRWGCFWAERFRSVLIESGKSVLYCLRYIDLNPVRAGIVERPEDYRWCSIAYHFQEGNRDGFLDFCGLLGENKAGKVDMSYYRQYVYLTGGRQIEGKGHIREKIIEEERSRGFKMPMTKHLSYRIRYFSDGLALGSKSFIQWAYEEYGGKVFHKKERKAHATGIGEEDDVFAIRRLNANPGSRFPGSPAPDSPELS